MCQNITGGIQDYVGDDVRVLYSQGAHLSKDRDEPLSKKYDRISEAKAVAELRGKTVEEIMG